MFSVCSQLGILGSHFSDQFLNVFIILNNTILLSPVAPSTHASTFCLYGVVDCRYKLYCIKMAPYLAWPAVTGLFSAARSWCGGRLCYVVYRVSIFYMVEPRYAISAPLCLRGTCPSASYFWILFIV